MDAEMKYETELLRRQLAIAEAALRRINAGYRNSSGLAMNEQAYGMCSEAKEALNDINKVADGLPVAHQDTECWPGRRRARRMFE